MNEDIIEKGEMAEEKFKEWLDHHKIPYWYIQQSFGTFSPALKENFGSKRVDFMVLVPNFGFMLIDVKNKKQNREYGDGKFILDCDETIKYSNLQRNFNLSVWYVLSNDDFDFKTWFWVPVTKVLEIGKIEKYTSKTRGDFFAIPNNAFIQVSTNDSLDRLFSMLFTQDLKK